MPGTSHANSKRPALLKLRFQVPGTWNTNPKCLALPKLRLPVPGPWSLNSKCPELQRPKGLHGIIIINAIVITIIIITIVIATYVWVKGTLEEVLQSNLSNSEGRSKKPVNISY